MRFRGFHNSILGITNYRNKTEIFVKRHTLYRQSKRLKRSMQHTFNMLSYLCITSVVGEYRKYLMCVFSYHQRDDFLLNTRCIRCIYHHKQTTDLYTYVCSVCPQDRLFFIGSIPKEFLLPSPCHIMVYTPIIYTCRIKGPPYANIIILTTWFFMVSFKQ